MTNYHQRCPSERARIRRLPTRGVYDRDTIYRIVDEALIGHVGFVSAGSPYVIPMVAVRKNDDLLLHGSAASRLTRHLAVGDVTDKGIPAALVMATTHSILRSELPRLVSPAAVLGLANERLYASIRPTCS